MMMNHIFIRFVQELVNQHGNACRLFKDETQLNLYISLILTFCKFAGLCREGQNLQVQIYSQFNLL
jgi:hypothetical protein